MLIKCYNETHPYLLFIDLEFDTRSLVQFAGLLFKKIDNDGGYQLMRSYNAYVTQNVCYPFAEYTSITNSFLQENGVRIQDVKNFIFEDFLEDIDLNQMMIISHGLRNDRMILAENGINLNVYNEKPIDGYCTFTNAKRILKRKDKMTLHDLCEECGYFLHHAHNAYNDVWGEVAIFTYLRKKEEEENNS